VRFPIALLEPLLDKGEKHAVLLLSAVKKRADVPSAIENRTGQPYFVLIPHGAISNVEQGHARRRDPIANFTSLSGIQPQSAMSSEPAVRGDQIDDTLTKN
jgi:hypothetical protein